MLMAFQRLELKTQFPFLLKGISLLMIGLWENVKQIYSNVNRSFPLPRSYLEINDDKLAHELLFLFYVLVEEPICP